MKFILLQIQSLGPARGTKKQYFVTTSSLTLTIVNFVKLPSATDLGLEDGYSFFCN